jgi:hypothetical protein
MKSLKPIFHGILHIFSMRSKSDAWTLLWMAFVAVLAVKHAIGDAAISTIVVAVIAPIVVKMITKHQQALAVINQPTTIVPVVQPSVQSVIDCVRGQL